MNEWQVLQNVLKKHNKGHKNVNIWARVKQIMKGNQKYLCQQQQPWQKMNFILYKFLHNEIQSKCFPFIAGTILCILKAS